jgi:hypothetical protein
MEFKFKRMVQPNRENTVKARGLVKAQGIHSQFQISKSDINIGGGERRVTITLDRV